MKISSSISVFIGRLCMCAIFIISGAGKFVTFSAVSQAMSLKGIPMAPIFLTAAAIIEILGGLSLFLGYKTRIWAVILFLYLIPVTLIFHDFWNFDEPQRHSQTIEFLKNLTIIGGLWCLIGAGPGRISLDASNTKHLHNRERKNIQDRNDKNETPPKH